MSANAQIESQKQVLVLAIFTLINAASKKANPKAQDRFKLQQLPCIYYPVQFGKLIVEVLMDSSSEVNAMQLHFITKLSLYIWKTNINAQKIDRKKLETYEMITALF